MDQLETLGKQLEMPVFVRKEEKNVLKIGREALKEAKTRGCKIYGIVGRDGGYTAQVGDAVVLVPTVDERLITPHAEAFQAVIWHCHVSSPILQIQATKW